MNTWIFLIAWLFVGYVFWFYLLKKPLGYKKAPAVKPLAPEEFTLTQPLTPGSLKLISLYITMVVGMAAVAIFKELKRSGSIIMTKVPVDFALALIVSPIVFRSIITFPIIAARDSFLYIYAFQNGFFWEATFNGFLEE